MCSDNDSLLSRFLFDLRINPKLPEPLHDNTIKRSANRTLRYSNDYYGKLMFLHPPIILSTGRVSPSMHWGRHSPLGRQPPRKTPPGRHLPGQNPPPGRQPPGYTTPPVQTPPHPETATAEDGTDPSGRHSCDIVALPLIRTTFSPIPFAMFCSR